MTDAQDDPIQHAISIPLPGVRRALRLIKPRTEAQLHGYIRAVLGFNMPRRSISGLGDAPFDYLAHAFFEDRSPRDMIVWANRSGGKTQLGAVATLLDMLFKPGVQIRILGGSFDQSSRMHRYLARMLQDEVFIDLLDGKLTGKAVQLVNGSRVEVLSQSERAVRGQRVHKLRCDEVELFDPAVWDAAQLVTRSGMCGGAFVRASVEALSTMHRPFGLMHRLVADAESADKRVFRWSLLDTIARCPSSRDCAACALEPDCAGKAKRASGFISIDDAIQQRKRVGDDVWRAEMLCQRPSTSDSVYPEFDFATHVRTKDVVSEDAVWLGGIDFGFRAPTVLLWAQHDPETDVLHIVDELVRTERTTEQYISEASAVDHPRPAWIGADPAGHQRNEHSGRTTISLWKAAGWPVRARRLSIEAGLRAVRRRLKRADGAATLFIHPRCEHLIESITMHHYPPDRPDSCAPVKDGHDHAVDALRYLVTNLDREDWAVRTRRY
jgi:hypothetical protein